MNPIGSSHGKHIVVKRLTLQPRESPQVHHPCRLSLALKYPPPLKYPCHRFWGCWPLRTSTTLLLHDLYFNTLTHDFQDTWDNLEEQSDGHWHPLLESLFNLEKIILIYTAIKGSQCLWQLKQLIWMHFLLRCSVLTRFIFIYVRFNLKFFHLLNLLWTNS